MHCAAYLPTELKSCRVVVLRKINGSRSEPLVIVEDFNVRVDWPDDAHGRRLFEPFVAYEQCRRNSEPTYFGSGTLDLAITRDDLDKPDVRVHEIGFSMLQ